jgi:eukaryotic-like serine/threonine-protein kinase
VFALDTASAVTQIGKYQVLGKLGEGGMGTVYRGMDSAIGREVAIKTLKEATEELRQRFKQEASSGVLNHPNIVTVYDFGEQNGNPYIVMEFISGDSLENLLKAGHQFTIIEKLEIIRQLCVGLGYAHQKGVIHRDVKPANIMVQTDGNIKIVDFGIARLGETRGHTQTGLVIGTLDYISPERLLGKPADGRADVWSAGVILYRLLTGRLPFLFPEGDSAALHRVIREPHEPLSNFLTDYPPALDNLIDTALAKSPSDRYETAEDMATDIEAINEGLKRDHVTQALGNVQALITQEQWTSAHPLLLELQRISPKNTEVKQLLRSVQDKLKRQQKTVQLREFLSGAEEAVLSQRYADAIEIYNRALDIDPGNPELLEKIEHVRQLKEKTDKVKMLLEQSREARKRNDLPSANQLIERALQLDERNTDLRNERARILQAAEKAEKERKLRQCIETAKNQLAARQYAEAVQSLRSALEIDPTDAETQRLFQEAVEREEEHRRRKIIGQIVAEISESNASEDFARALTLIQRAQERLPGEAVLLQLKADAEAGYREQTAKKLIEQTTLQVYNLFQSDPQEALAIVQKALLQMPGETQLLGLQAKVTEQIKKGNAQEQKSASLKRAQAAMDARQFEQAVQILQNAAIVCGEDPEIASLLAFAQKQKRSVELSQAVDNATREARALMEDGDFERAIARLQPVASETRDTSIEQLLSQANSSLAELARQAEALVNRAKATSESVGGLEEAIQMLQKQLQATPKIASAKELLTTLLAKREQQQETGKKIRAAREAARRKDFSSALKDLHTVQLAYGESAELTVAIQEVEAERSSYAQDIVGQSIKSAQAALLNGNSPAAIEALKSATPWMEFTDDKTQADWQRIGQSVKKDREQTGTTATRGAVFDEQLSEIEKAKPKKFPVALVAVAAVALLAIAATFVWKVIFPQSHTTPESKIRIKITNPQLPPGATVKIDDGAPQAIPASGELTLTVQQGSRHILVSASGYDEFRDTVSAEPGLATEPVLMTSIPVGVETGTFSPSPQPDLLKVRVYVNGELKGEKQAGQEIRLPVNTYRVKYAWPGYLESKEHQVVIAKGVNFPDSFILVEAPKTPTTGQLTIQSTANAQVSVDGTGVGSIEPSGSLTIASVPQGSRQIHVAPPANSNLLASDKTVDVVAGKDNTVTVSLKEAPKIPPATIASFTVDPPNGIKQGDAAILSWKVTDATSISIDPNVDTGGQFLGSRSVKPSKNQTYTLTAIGKDGQPVTERVNVTVNVASTPPPPPPPPPPGLPDPATLVSALGPYKDVFKQASDKKKGDCEAVFKSALQGMLREFAGSCDGTKSFDASAQPSCKVGGLPESPTLTCTQAVILHPMQGKPTSTSDKRTFHFTKGPGDSWQLSAR